MLAIAAENNLSETAFIRKLQDNRYEIRWFSPLVEIDFCGHATLAAAHVLFHEHAVQGVIEFVTREVGSLQASLAADGHIEMVFPLQAPTPVELCPPEIVAGLSKAPVRVLLN
ncbi:TPA: PhzF family phenazine biosynthesis protein, partial [Klebsiella pneumoniae]